VGANNIVAHVQAALARAQEIHAGRSEAGEQATPGTASAALALRSVTAEPSVP
jgi:hypothetical protein